MEQKTRSRGTPKGAKTSRKRSLSQASLRKKTAKKRVFRKVKCANFPKDHQWTPEKFKAFANEIDSIRQVVQKNGGKKDVAYLKKVRKISKRSEILGRTFLQFSLDPFSWLLGTFFLFVHKQIDSIEIGHHALHGAWDDNEDCEGYRSSDHWWNVPVEEKEWKRVHNILHHQYTNILGKDPDINYSFLRSSENTPWAPHHLLQFFKILFSAPFFPWMVNFYVTGLVEVLRGNDEEEYTTLLPDRKLKTILRTLFLSAKKTVPYSLKDFVFWPLLAGPFWWKVLAGNLVADGLRNTWCWASIYPGHFGEDLPHHATDFRPHGRGEWYRSQIESTHNFTIPKIFDLLCGGMEHQIEHHLFPKMPPNRLREVAHKIAKLCKKYDVSYTSPSWGKAIQMALGKVFWLSLPPKVVGALKKAG